MHIAIRRSLNRCASTRGPRARGKRVTAFAACRRASRHWILEASNILQGQGGHSESEQSAGGHQPCTQHHLRVCEDRRGLEKIRHFATSLRQYRNASEYGITPAVAETMGYKRELQIASASLRKMHKRGIRILPGGDYGFAWMPARHECERSAVFRRLHRHDAHRGLGGGNEGWRAVHAKAQRTRHAAPGVPGRHRDGGATATR